MKKEIIFVAPSFQVGGTEGHLVNVISGLVSRGWKVKVIALIEKGPLASKIEKHGIVVFCLASKWIRNLTLLPSFFRCLLIAPLAILKLSIILKKNPNTIVHFFLPFAYVLGMTAVMLSRFSGDVLMSRRSLNLYAKKKPFLKSLEMIFHKRTTKILANSIAVLSELKDKESVPLEKLSLIYNGIDFHRFQCEKSKLELRNHLKIPCQGLVFITLANLISYKGHADLLKALAMMNHKIKDWHLLCVGRNDGAGSQLKKQASQLGIGTKISWLGVRNDIPELLCCADIGVLPSHQEGFSNAILESMAAGLPMVVTDVGGNNEAVIPNQVGYVVPTRSPVQLSEALYRLAGNVTLRESMGAKAQMRVREKFSLEHCVDQYENCYRSLEVVDDIPCVV